VQQANKDKAALAKQIDNATKQTEKNSGPAIASCRDSSQGLHGTQDVGSLTVAVGSTLLLPMRASTASSTTWL